MGLTNKIIANHALKIGKRNNTSPSNGSQTRIARARIILSTGVVGIIGCLIGLLGLDRPLAEVIHSEGVDKASVLSWVLALLDLVSGKRFSNIAVAAGLIVIGVMGLIAWRHSIIARAALFAAVVQLTTDGIALLLKHAAGRLRPHIAMAGADWHHVWFAGGDSFPSGHVAYYWGLLLPVAYLFPRRWALWLFVPTIVSVLRIVLDDHFLSDVGMSMILAATACAGWGYALRAWIGVREYTPVALVDTAE